MLISVPTLTLLLSISLPPPSPVWIAWCFWTALPHVPYGDQVLFWKKMENCIQSDSTSVLLFYYYFPLLFFRFKTYFIIWNLPMSDPLCQFTYPVIYGEAQMKFIRDVTFCFRLLVFFSLWKITWTSCAWEAITVYWFGFWHLEWP